MSSGAEIVFEKLMSLFVSLSIHNRYPLQFPCKTLRNMVVLFPVDRPETVCDRFGDKDWWRLLELALKFPNNCHTLCFVLVAAVKFGRMSKKQREKVEDEVRFHRAQMRAQSDAPDSSVFDTQIPSSSDQLHHSYNRSVCNITLFLKFIIDFCLCSSLTSHHTVTMPIRMRWDMEARTAAIHHRLHLNRI